MSDERRAAAKNALKKVFQKFLGAESKPTVGECDEFLNLATKVVEEFCKDNHKCCRFYGVNSIDYKGIYLPSPDEFEAHGYKRELYDRFLEGWKRDVDEGRMRAKED